MAAAETPAAAVSTRRREIGRVTLFLPVLIVVAGSVGNALSIGKRRARNIYLVMRAGLTRASIHLRKSPSKKMDSRVKPGHDGAIL
jgi:hypothetical protein